MECDNCKNKKRSWSLLKGDGWCSIHQKKFFFAERNKPCPICAKENNLCERCGKKFEKIIIFKDI